MVIMGFVYQPIEGVCYSKGIQTCRMHLDIKPENYQFSFVGFFFL